MQRRFSYCVYSTLKHSTSLLQRSIHRISQKSLPISNLNLNLNYLTEKRNTVSEIYNKNTALMQSEHIAIAGGVLAFVIFFRPIYEKYIRKDVPVDPKTSPVLKLLKLPVHGSHRGGSRIWPENTMLAFRNAVEWKNENEEILCTQVLEFDIQKTIDGHLVIMHNLTVDSTTDGNGFVKDFTLEEIKKLDAGYRFTVDGKNYPFRNRGIRVPTLLEVLEEFVPKKNLIFYLDFKSPDSVFDTFELVKKFDIEERIICGAIPKLANKEILKLKPSCVPVTPDKISMISMYVLYMLNLLWIYPMKFEIVGTTPHRWGYKVLTVKMVKAFHDRNRLMAVFGDYLDHSEGQMDCLSLGCDLLITDRPDILHSTLQKWKNYKNDPIATKLVNASS